MSSTKQIDALVAHLRAQGAAVILRGKRWRVTKPGLPLVWLPKSDPHGRGGHGHDNKIAELRKKGYDV